MKKKTHIDWPVICVCAEYSKRIELNFGMNAILSVYLKRLTMVPRYSTGITTISIKIHMWAWTLNTQSVTALPMFRCWFIIWLLGTENAEHTDTFEYTQYTIHNKRYYIVGYVFNVFLFWYVQCSIVQLVLVHSAFVHCFRFIFSHCAFYFEPKHMHASLIHILTSQTPTKWFSYHGKMLWAVHG